MYKKTISPSNETIVYYDNGNERVSFSINTNHYEVKKYLEWVAEGNEAEEVEE